MISRDITLEFLTLLNEYPVVTILGPRQAGKTTLARSLDNYEYYNLEAPDTRELIKNDPRTFLAQIKGNVILDEIQRIPELLSYLQVYVDEKKKNGQFILTGSHQLQLKEAISQSLAGRTAILNLLPLSIKELSGEQIEFDSFEQYVIHGFLPRVYDQKQRPTLAYSNYYQSYVERDVRQLINIKDSNLFEKFIKLLAGRVGQLLDLSSLGNDVGVDAKTIKNWLSILEASFVVYKLSPYFENFGKRVIKSPKYYFSDVGLLAFLLGLETPQQVRRDPLLGSIFENLVIMECYKNRLNQGLPANLYFYRDSQHNEIDLIFQKGRELIPIEIKSTATFHISLIKNLATFKKTIPSISDSYLIYSGDSKKINSEISALNYKEVFEIF